MTPPIQGHKKVIKMINVKSLKFDADQKLLDFVQKKVDRWTTKFIMYTVVLSLLPDAENKKAKIQTHIPGQELVIERSARTFEEAITEAVDAMKEKIIRYKEKKFDR